MECVDARAGEWLLAWHVPGRIYKMKDFFAQVQQGRPFIKMHGLRNDFIIVDARKDPFVPSREEISHICDRHEGIGGDELLILTPPSDPANDVFMGIYNPDGQEVEACGNATRCLGLLLFRETGKKHTKVETLGGVLSCEYKGDGQVSIEMGEIKTRWDEIPLSKEMDTLHLGIENGPLKDPVGMNIGNPHAVFFVDNFDEIDLSLYGRELETHPLFPEDANIGMAQVMDENTLKLVVWERPGMLTQACGSGACVAAAAAVRRGLLNTNTIQVVMPAGSMTIELTENNRAIMTGPAEFCFSGYLPDKQFG